MNTRQLAENMFQTFIDNRSGTIKVKRISDNFIEGETGMLAYLTFVENGVTPGRLVEKLNISSARVANLLNALEKKGFLRRIADPEDKRRTIVVLRDEKKEEILNLKEDVINHFAKVIEELGEKDLNEFVRIAKRIDEISLKILEEK